MVGKDDKLVLKLEQTLKLRLRHFLIENDKNCGKVRHSEPESDETKETNINILTPCPSVIYVFTVSEM
jgi:hypothetical protein